MRFGKFQVLARLASGGTANIFLSRQVEPASLRRLVVLKTLLPDRTSDPDFRAMFTDESQLAWALSHPNCVSTYEFGTIRGIQFIAMEYIIGEPLSALLVAGARARTIIPPVIAAEIIHGAALGLHHAHELRDDDGRPYNIVHRDVSPQNIMITAEGHVKVLDFGVAKAETAREPTAFGVVKGKFGYMSPEQIEGNPVDRRSDVFSLGIVLFESLSGRRLFQAHSVEEVALQILSRPIPKLSDVVPDMPPMLVDICAKALTRKLNDRFASAKALADALEVFLKKSPKRGGRALVAEQLRRTCPGQVESAIALSESILDGRCEQGELLKSLRANPVNVYDIFGSLTPDANVRGDAESYAIPIEEDIQELDDASVRPLDSDDLDATHSFDQIGERHFAEDLEAERTNHGHTFGAGVPSSPLRVGGSPSSAYATSHEELSSAGQTSPTIELARNGPSVTDFALQSGNAVSSKALASSAARQDSRREGAIAPETAPPWGSELKSLESSADLERSIDTAANTEIPSTGSLVDVEAKEEPSITLKMSEGGAVSRDAALEAELTSPLKVRTEVVDRSPYDGAPVVGRRSTHLIWFAIGLALGLVVGVFLQRTFGGR